MNELQVFTSEECGEIRVLKRDNEAWFVAVDVCKCLEINNARQAVTRLDDDEKTTVISNDGRQMNIISESGLYSLVLSSRKKEAKAFKRWVTHDVLPSIRKTGGYNASVSDEYKAKRLEIMAMNARARQMKEENKRLEALLKSGKVDDLPATAILSMISEKPERIPETHTATEVGEMLGVSANKIGRLATKHNLKTEEYGEWFRESINNGEKQSRRSDTIRTASTS